MAAAISGYSMYNAPLPAGPLAAVNNHEAIPDSPKQSPAVPSGSANVAIADDNHKNSAANRTVPFPNDGLAQGLKVELAQQEKMLKQIGAKECKTCSERRYQDGSNDPGVSFKAPTYVNPAMAGAVVSAHEQEHVQREQARAKQEGREVVSQSVRLYNSKCPECGRIYVAGGETITVTAAKAAYSEASKIMQSGNETGQLDLVA